MAECRYYAMCDMCDRAGDDWLPCDGTDDGTVCGHFEPMPDVKALLALAEEFDERAETIARHIESSDGDFDCHAIDAMEEKYGYARRIREALGVVA